MNLEERYAEVVALIEELAEANASAVLVVEGERDVRTLRDLGLTGDLLAMNRGDTVFRFCERLAEIGRPIIILTDWDVRGGQLARLLRDGLAANGVAYDDAFRAKIAILCQKEIKSVEDLGRYLERLAPRGDDGRRRLAPNRAWYAGRSPLR